ncbi:MAG: S41 family peptidase [Opitutales bacterium]|nr:S41 family peptidase [Opitutales bacterium]
MVKRYLPPVAAFVVCALLAVWVLTSPFWQTVMKVSTVMRIVHDEYVDAESVSYERLRSAAIEGIMASLDTHSRYMPREDFERFEESTQQRYVGIGVEIERLRERVTVITVFDGGPASEAGLLPGDQIIAVGEEDAADWSVGDVAQRLRGPSGERVSVTLTRPLSGEVLEVGLTRAPVRLASVRDERLDDEGFGYIALRQFGDRTPGEVREAAERFAQKGARGLVIDLRDNPGGLLHAAKAVADVFLPRGQLIVSMEGRRKRDRVEFRAEEPAMLEGVPLVVILNESSASGAEIVAGALQDALRATVVGATSYGKGSVQSVYSFRAGDALRQTTARYLLPGGRSIDEVGIEPDVVVEFSEEERAELILQERHSSILGAEAFEEIFGWPPDRTDKPLQTALDILREQVEERARQNV